MQDAHDQRRQGLLFAVGAYLSWGVLPIYWKLLHHVPATQILAHRMVWSLAVVVGLIALRRGWRAFAGKLRSRRTLLAFTASSLLLSVNWYLYIWAVNADRVVEASLGYFINPLVNVVLGIAFLRERLRAGQALAVSVAAAGVIYLAVTQGTPPWIALALAFTFGFYGLLRKTGRLDSQEGLALETAIVFLPALAFLLLADANGQGAFGHSGAQTDLLLALSGAATAVPLLFFAAGARRIPLGMLGLLQYISPSIQFLLGVFLYGESMSRNRLLGFGLVWLALLIYAFEGLIYRPAVTSARFAER